MKKKRFNYLKKVYKVEGNSKTFIVEISLDDYNDIFNDWDPAPFKRRDIDPDLNHFLLDSSEDIPLKYPLKLCFFIPKEEKDLKEEELAKSGLKNYFDFLIIDLIRKLKILRQKGALYIITSFIFLTVAAILKTKLEVGILTDTLLEGLFIGGWVFLWEAFTLLFFSSYDLYRELKVYKRLSNANIQFKYEEN